MGGKALKTGLFHKDVSTTSPIDHGLIDKYYPTTSKYNSVNKRQTVGRNDTSDKI